MPFFDNNKTLKPLRQHKKAKAAALHRYAVTTLGSGDMRAAVALPAGEDENEWIAMHSASYCHLFECFQLPWRVASIRFLRPLTHFYHNTHHHLSQP